MRIRQIFSLVLVNFRIFFREPGAWFWSFAFPVGMAWVLGIAFSNAPEKKYTVLVVGETTLQQIFPKEQLMNKTKILGEGTGVVARVDFKEIQKEQVETIMKTGGSLLYINSAEGKIIFHYDPANAEAVNLFMLLEREIYKPVNPSVVSVQKIEAKGIRYVDFLIPGLLAMGIMNSCVWGISWYLIELRMKKLLRRMVATPMKKSTFIISHFITRFCLTMFESSILVLFSWLFFGLEMTGSFFAFVLLYLSGILTFGGIGLLLGSRTQSTHVGNGLINAVVLPMTIVSGIFFSYDSFPKWAIPLIKVLPLTILTDGVRAIFNQGAGLSEILIPCSILTFLGLSLYLAGLKLFKWY